MRWQMIYFRTKNICRLGKSREWEKSPLTCHKHRQSSPGKWYVEETVSVNFQPHTDSQGEVLGYLVQLLLVSPQETRMQIQVITTRKWQSQLQQRFGIQIPASHKTFSLASELWEFRQYIKMITLNSMKKKLRPWR